MAKDKFQGYFPGPHGIYYRTSPQEREKRAAERSELRAQEQDNEPKISQKQKITKKEANIRARKILKKKPLIKSRELAKEIPCSIGLVPKLPAWKAVMEQRRKGRKPKKIRLTNKMLSITGTDKKNETINRLMIEQQADMQEDDRQAKLFLSNKKKPPNHD